LSIGTFGLFRISSFGFRICRPAAGQIGFVWRSVPFLTTEARRARRMRPKVFVKEELGVSLRSLCLCG
jgi:hypothetical protein